MLQKVKFLTRVNVRSQPTLRGKIQRVMNAGDIGVTWAEPIDGDLHRWFLIQLANGETGWAAFKDGVTPLIELSPLPIEFLTAMDFTLKWEGGYVNNPADPGGETNFGITKMNYPMLDIKQLGKEQAEAIYYMDYWLPIGASRFTYPKYLLLFDIAVLCGKGKARTYEGLKLLDIIASQFKYFTGLSSFNIFGRGWTNRTVDLLDIVISSLEDS